MMNARARQANRLGAGRSTVAAALLASNVAVLAACGGGAAEGTASVVRGAAASTTVPGAPVIEKVEQFTEYLIVTYTAPNSNGGLPITKYTATSKPDGMTETKRTSKSGALWFTKLTEGKDYTFTVTATNNNGTSIPSAPSASITYWGY